jgi:hypothetical protein
MSWECVRTADAPHRSLSQMTSGNRDMAPARYACGGAGLPVSDAAGWSCRIFQGPGLHGDDRLRESVHHRPET